MEGSSSATNFAKELQNVLLKPDGTLLGEEAPAAIGGKILGLYFSASWCPPCHAFTPVLAQFYRDLKKERDDFEIVFVSSDKSAVEFKAYAAQMPWLSLDFERRDLKGALGQAFNVTGIPTLVWLDKDGTVLTLEGRKKVMTEPEQFPWKGDRKEVATGTVGKYEDLGDVVDTRNTVCLNAAEEGGLGALFKEGGGRIESDADEQLLFNVVFTQTVKIHSFQLLGQGGGAPCKVSLYLNRVAMGFEDAEDLKPVETFTLTAAQATDPAAPPVEVNFVNYQKVSQLAFFIESNQEGGDVTNVTHIKLQGLK